MLTKEIASKRIMTPEVADKLVLYGIFIEGLTTKELKKLYRAKQKEGWFSDEATKEMLSAINRFKEGQGVPQEKK
jgi:post-segregation antitoxin (ccd killing protein)